MSDDSENKEINNKKEPKYSLPGNHIDITDKKETIDLSKILNEDCDLILFELPKNFDKEKLKQLKLKTLISNKKSQEMKFIKDYKCISYDESHPNTKQSLAVLKKKKNLVFKPINKYIKVFEAIELLEPEQNAIIKRKLKEKK